MSKYITFNILLLALTLVPSISLHAEIGAGVHAATSLQDDTESSEKKSSESLRLERNKSIQKTIKSLKKELSKIPQLSEKQSDRNIWLRVTMSLPLKQSHTKSKYIQKSSDLIGQSDFLNLFTNPKLIEKIDFEYLLSAMDYIETMEQRYKDRNEAPKAKEAEPVPY